MGDINLEMKLNNLNEKVIKNINDVDKLDNKTTWSLKASWVTTFTIENSEMSQNEVKEFLVVGGTNNSLGDHIIVNKSSYDDLFIYHTNSKTVYTIDNSKNAIITLENSCLIYSKG